MTLRLILVRHGLSTFNKDFRIQGRNDLSTLTNEGISQAIETGKFLADLPIKSAYSSPLQRASQTTKEILKQRQKELNPIFTDDLLEIDLGPWSGLTKEEVKLKFPNDHLTWQKNPMDLTFKGEDGKEYKPLENLMVQADNFIQKLINNHTTTTQQNILIVGHNAILRCILLVLLGNPLQGFRKIQIDNTSVSILNIKKGKLNPYEVQLESLNSTTHLKLPIPLKKSGGRVILVRHGETNWNLEGRFQGQIDIPLNNTGREQASAAGYLLKNLSIEKAFSSSMSRPKETAEIILRSHPDIQLKLEKELVEIGHGLWEGKLESEIKGKWSELLQKWKDFPETVQMPDGENIQEVLIRSVKCWKEICKGLNSGETALVVAHDAVNKTILCHLLGLTAKNIWMIKQSNGGITIVDISNDSNNPDVITCLNITSHLGGVIDRTTTGAL